MTCRGMRVAVCLASGWLVGAVVASGAEAQAASVPAGAPAPATGPTTGSPTASAASTNAAPATTLADVKHWLEVNLPTLARGAHVKVSAANDWVLTESHIVIGSVLNTTECTLRVQSEWRRVGQNETSTYADVIPLRLVDVRGIRVGPETPLLEAARLDPPATVLTIPANALYGAAFEEFDGDRQRRKREVEIWVRSTEDGQRLAAAVRRAAELCGAKPDPF